MQRSEKICFKAMAEEGTDDGEYTNCLWYNEKHCMNIPKRTYHGPVPATRATTAVY